MLPVLWADHSPSTARGRFSCPHSRDVQLSPSGVSREMLRLEGTGAGTHAFHARVTACAQSKWERRLSYIRQFDSRAMRALLWWSRIVHVARRARRLRRICSHGLFFITTVWHDFKWDGIVRPRPLHDENETEEDADVNDAVSLLRKVEVHLCLRVLLTRFFPAFLALFTVAWGILRYVTHTLLCAFLETYYVRRIIATFVFITVFRVACWLGFFSDSHMMQGALNLTYVVQRPATPYDWPALPR